jgi:hypothetical protein
MAITYTNIVTKVIKELEQEGKEVVVIDYRPDFGWEPPREKGSIPRGKVCKRGQCWHNREEIREVSNNVFVIECEPVNDPLSLATFLHEVGHVVNNDCEDHRLKHRTIFNQVGNPHVIKQEIGASRYALRRMREFGIPTQEAAIGLTKCLRSYGSNHTLRP